ncbi:hypothetical protein GGS21DRAFT_488292 [Xylaria nigripes]|nr:hypothetical protein GGS21DRAFT_488292 [Xylaria nigripes]
MVSFFGLKIGGERKKKTSKDIAVPPPLDLDKANAIDGDLPDVKGEPTPCEPNVGSLSRQDSSLSALSKKSTLEELGLAPLSSNKLASSMVDLPKTSGLRHHASNPGFSSRYNAGSSKSLGIAPLSFDKITRPNTSDGERKVRANPPNVPFTRDSAIGSLRSPLSPSVTFRDGGLTSPLPSAALKSPLGQYELKLDLPNDVSSFADFGDLTKSAEAPAPLRIKKQASTGLSSELPEGDQPPQEPLTPPRSIDRKETLRTQVAEPSPPGAQSPDYIPMALRELENAISNLGPTSLPSPPINSSMSEDKVPTISTTTVPRSASRSTKKGNARPVIQNVCARRDTLTISTQRRRSLLMRIEAAENGTVPSLFLVDRPKASKNRRPFERPPPLDLNKTSDLREGDRIGPQTAPFLQNPPRLSTPTSSRPPLQFGFDTREQPNGSALVNEARSGVNSPVGSSIYDDDNDEEDEEDEDEDEDDKEEFEHPVSPESTSPVIPLTGPLASPCFPPPSQSPHSYFSKMPEKGAIDSDDSPSTIIPPIPPRSIRRNPPKFDSTGCPIPSPLMPSFDRAAISTPSADPHSRLGPESIPAPLSGALSPAFRLFGRSPAATTTDACMSPPVKRPQTAGQPTTSAAQSKPPPMPTRTKTEASKRAFARLRGKHLGVGFR